MGILEELSQQQLENSYSLENAIYVYFQNMQLPRDLKPVFKRAISELYTRLKTNSGEEAALSTVFNAIVNQQATSLTGKPAILCTQWFRDFNIWNKPFNGVLDLLTKQKVPEIHIASVGCSTGEEVYTLAMLLADQLGIDANWSIEGWDFNPQNLASTAQGIYKIPYGSGISLVPHPILESVPTAKRHFTIRSMSSGIEQWAASDALKQHIIPGWIDLKNYDLLPALQKIDILFCRYVHPYVDDILFTKLEKGTWRRPQNTPALLVITRKEKETVYHFIIKFNPDGAVTKTRYS